MELVALVPARAGSKRLPGKNLLRLGGKTLVQIACEEAQAASFINETFVSTDSPDIIKEAQRLSVVSPYVRKEECSTDLAPMILVLQEFVDWMDSSGRKAEAIVLLQPTSPLRLSRHIDEACKLYLSGNFDTVVSVVRVPHQCHPRKVMSLRGEKLVPYLLDGPQMGNTGDLDPAFARNGPAILISSIKDVRHGRLYGDRVGAYEMAPECSVDIDTQADFDLAEFYMTRRESKTAE
ncbi:acylneuraminate cytidylyltransferase family protein [Thalassospira povalilytica]|uniref:acylneuraminate cytidylyltransferase family protein n=1 Tax=Thalassospira povalilytica TaxID=732237 RepID=UPI003AA83219